MRFKVRALKPGQGVHKLVVEAAGADEAGRQAAAEGLAVLSVAPMASLGGERATRFPLQLVNQEMLALLDSGITVIEALETLAEKETRGHVRSVLERVGERLREGRTLSAALAEHPDAFPPLYVASIKASERTSDLSQALRRYIAYQSQLEGLREKIVNAAIYPALLLVVGGLVILFLMGYVVPRFAHIYEDVGSHLPWMSRLLLGWGTLLHDHAGALAALALALLAAGWALFDSPRAGAALQNAAWRIPALGARMRMFQLARFYRTLGMLQRGGMAIVPALEMVGGLLSPALRQGLTRAVREVREGQPLSASMAANDLTTPVALRMLRVGERAGNLGEMMENIALFHDAEIARWAERFTRLFGPLLMLLIGVAIGLIVVLMYLPIFQLAESLG